MIDLLLDTSYKYCTFLFVYLTVTISLQNSDSKLDNSRHVSKVRRTCEMISFW